MFRIGAGEIAVVLLFGLVGCATTTSSETRPAPAGDGEGLSCEQRVKVPGIPSEYEWVKAHYPGAKVKMQSLSDCGGSPTDKLHVTTGDGRELTLFFDISSFF